jgi:hypothetical protein
VAREIDILSAAAVLGCVIVDKASHVLWTRQDLDRAAAAGCYGDEDCVGPASPASAVSGPYPGCPQQWGRPADLTHHPLLGETEHFAIFAPPGMSARARAART